MVAALAGLVLAGGVVAWPTVRDWSADLTAPCGIVVDGERVSLDQAQARAATQAAAQVVRGGQRGGAPGGGAAVEVPDGVVEAVLSARADTALTCRVGEPDVAAEEVGGSGLTPRAEAVLEEVREDFGDVLAGGFAPGGVDSGHGAESTHYDGRAVDVFYRPVTEESRDQGWVLAQWLVAHAEELTVQYVIFDDHWWGVRQSAGGWQAYDVPGAPGTQDPVLRHLDHVHVDVVRGG